MGWASLCLYHPSCIQAKGCPSSSSWCFCKEAGRGARCVHRYCEVLGTSQVRPEPSCRWKLGRVYMQVWKGNWFIKEERKWMEMGKKASLKAEGNLQWPIVQNGKGVEGKWYKQSLIYAVNWTYSSRIDETLIEKWVCGPQGCVPSQSQLHESIPWSHSPSCSTTLAMTAVAHAEKIALQGILLYFCIKYDLTGVKSKKITIPYVLHCKI